MLTLGAVGAAIFLILVIADWMYFARMTAPGSRYGCQVARLEDRLGASPTPLNLCFDQDGVLRLPHGIACLFPGQCTILLRPHYHSFSTRIRTVWPMKATIRLQCADNVLYVVGAKRMPWSSALLTLAWLFVVGVGTAGFLVVFLMNDGFSSFGGVLLGLGVTALGVLVLAFGLIIVALAYRLENQRLTQTYEELRQILAPTSAPSS